MAHVLIAGMTLSGKTTLARKVCAQYRASGVQCLVLDPIADPRWQTDYRTSEQDVFLDWYWHSRQCAVFIDEGGESVGRYNDAMTKTATRGRHWGHRNHYIVQEATQIAKIIRSQCTHLYLFASAVEDGETLARAWNHPALRECNTLKTGEFFYAVKMGTCTRHALFNQPVRSESNESADNANRGGRDNSRRGSTRPKKGEHDGGPTRFESNPNAIDDAERAARDRSERPADDGRND